MQLRRVWGKPTVDRVTVDYYAHRGSKKEQHLRKQINLADGQAVLAFELQNGRRQEPIEQQQVANAVNGQLAVGRAILAQQAVANNNPQAVNQQLNQVSSNGRIGQLCDGHQQRPGRVWRTRHFAVHVPGPRWLPAGYHHAPVGHEHVGHGRRFGRSSLRALHHPAVVLVDSEGQYLQLPERLQRHQQRRYRQQQLSAKIEA